MDFNIAFAKITYMPSKLVTQVKVNFLSLTNSGQYNTQFARTGFSNLESHMCGGQLKMVHS